MSFPTSFSQNSFRPKFSFNVRVAASGNDKTNTSNTSISHEDTFDLSDSDMYAQAKNYEDKTYLAGSTTTKTLCTDDTDDGSCWTMAQVKEQCHFAYNKDKIQDIDEIVECMFDNAPGAELTINSATRECTFTDDSLKSPDKQCSDGTDMDGMGYWTSSSW